MYILSGLLRCGLCKEKMYGYTSRKKLTSGEVREYTYYRCATSSRKGTSACRGQIIEGEPLESIVVDSILKISENRAILTEKKKRKQGGSRP